MNPITELNRLLLAVEKAGLGTVASLGNQYAFDTAWRISSTKADLENRWESGEMVKAYNDDTLETARVLSNPANWGIADEKWKEFCKEWK